MTRMWILQNRRLEGTADTPGVTAGGPSCQATSGILQAEGLAGEWPGSTSNAEQGHVCDKNHLKSRDGTTNHRKV